MRSLLGAWWNNLRTRGSATFSGWNKTGWIPSRSRRRRRGRSRCSSPLRRLCRYLLFNNLFKLVPASFARGPLLPEIPIWKTPCATMSVRYIVIAAHASQHKLAMYKGTFSHRGHVSPRGSPSRANVIRARSSIWSIDVAGTSNE